MLLPIEIAEKTASEQQAEKLEAEAEANEAQADADRQKADAARMKESWAKGEQGRKQWEAWFKEQPQEFQDKWNEMNELYGDVVKDQYKTAAGGLYGYTKGTQRDVEATVRKATKYATKLAKSLYAKDERSVDFLKTHAKRGSKTAKLILAAMANVGPRLASVKSAGSNPFPDLKRYFPGQAVQAAFPGPFDPSTPDALGDRDNVVSYARMFGDIAGWSQYADIAIIAGEDGKSLDMVHRKDGKWYWGASVDLEPWRTASSSSVFELPIEKAAAKRKSPANGMYGFPSKVARISLTACSDLKSYIGEVAYDLHSRRVARHSRITGFLKEHTKTANCGYSSMLLSCYPDAPVSKEANQKLPGELEENKWTDSDGDNPPPNPKGSDADGDGETNEPKPFKSAAKSSDFMPGDRVVYWVHGKGTVTDVWEEYGKTGITIEWDNGDVSNPMDRSRLMADLQKLEGDLELVEGDVIELSNGDQGTVERVRDVDAWVAFPYGSSWVPLKNIKKVVTKYRRRRSASARVVANMLRKAFVPDGEGKIEWEDGTRVAGPQNGTYEIHSFHQDENNKPVREITTARSYASAKKAVAQAHREGKDGYIIYPDGGKSYFHEVRMTRYPTPHYASTQRRG